jgi:hypothetical protein
MKYISISEDNKICFKDDDINIILNTDKPISDELYNMFFEQQSMGKSFKLKNIDGTTFEEIFEEYQLYIAENRIVSNKKNVFQIIYLTN